MKIHQIESLKTRSEAIRRIRFLNKYENNFSYNDLRRVEIRLEKNIIKKHWNL
jgi:hypothetical protein